MGAVGVLGQGAGNTGGREGAGNTGGREGAGIMAFDWNKENVDKLRQLWEDGISTSQIGRRLGVSKNTIVGKAHRLDLTPRPSPIKGVRDDETRQRILEQANAARAAKQPTLPPLPSQIALTAPVPIKPVFVAPVAPPPPPVQKAPRAKECCWPIGEPGRKGFRFCDSPDVVGGTPYCAEHCKVAYTKLPTSPERLAYLGSKLPVSAAGGGAPVRGFAD